MSDAVEALNHAMNADVMRLKSISQNLANINTQGYKREVLSSGSFAQALNNADRVINADQLPTHSIQRDMSAGRLKLTQSPYDLALEGNAMFVANSQTGAVYTRQGQVMIDNQGRLALQSGELLQGKSGAIYLEPGDFVIKRDGMVEQNGVALDQLSIVRFEQDTALEYIGSGNFVSPQRPVAVDSSEYRVMQGYVELSNVNSMDEMVRLIETTRHFETSHQVLRGYDDMLDSAINVLGEL